MIRQLAALRLPAFALAMAFLVVEATDGQDNQPKADRELIEPFKGKPGIDFKFRLWGADAPDHVAFEPSGLRINLPAGFPKARENTGVSTDISVKGDFEVAVRYEILQEPTPEDAGPATAFTLMLVQDRTRWHMVGLSRKVALDKRVPDGVFFRTYFQFFNEKTGKGDTKGAVFPTKSKSGRLRLVRTGPVVAYFAADGPNVKDFIRSAPPAKAHCRAVASWRSTSDKIWLN